MVDLWKEKIQSVILNFSQIVQTLVLNRPSNKVDSFLYRGD